MQREKTKKVTKISLFTALIAVTALITVPFPIPFTLQTFGIFLALMTLGGISGAIAITVYVALGAIGLPVFAGFGAGIGYILGASGGFVISFPAAALLYALLEKLFGKEHGKKAVYAFISLAMIYLIGSLWFAYIYSGGSGFGEALTVCVLPFIIPDLIKIFLALYISKRLDKLNTF